MKIKESSLVYHVPHYNFITFCSLTLTFSFARTSDEVLDGSEGQTPGFGHGSVLSEALLIR